MGASDGRWWKNKGEFRLFSVMMFLDFGRASSRKFGKVSRAGPRSSECGDMDVPHAFLLPLLLCM